MSAALRFEGVWTAIVTPFARGPLGPADHVDLDGLDRLVDEQIAAGVDVLVPCGTTGESPTLSHKEHDAVVARVVERAAGRVPVVAGAGSNSTREAERLCRAARDAGADGVLVVCPYYNRPTERMLHAHFGRVARASDLPIVLYNIPSRTGVDLGPGAVAALVEEHPTIRALKAASGSVDRAAEVCRHAGVAVLSGDDALTLPMIAVGARGVISVAANVVPERVVGLVAAALAGDLESALARHRDLLPLVRALFAETNPVPVKAALRLLGRGNGAVRAPLLEALPSTVERLATLLA